MYSQFEALIPEKLDSEKYFECEVIVCGLFFQIITIMYTGNGKNKE